MSRLIPRCSISRMASVDFSEVASNANIMALLPLKLMDDLESEDRISEFPDDILLTILFQLEMKEAAKASVLSKRWRYMWTNWTDLDFDHLKIIPECGNYYAYPKPIETTKYLNWVNQVIRLHSGQSINKFRVRLGFHESQVHDIDRWVTFALSKQVKNLELELPFYHSTEAYYTLKPSLLESGISFLTSLHLTEVNVSGELLELVLLECHLLERLFVECSDILVRLKVASFNLKQLSIRYCGWLKELEIDAVNLSYLDYIGQPTIEFKSIPSSLVEVSLGGGCCGATVPICQQIAGFAKQLSKFSLDIMIDLFVMDHLPKTGVICNIPAEGLPHFSNLKFLELIYCDDTVVDPPSITRLLGACPMLCEFKMEVDWTKGYVPEEATMLQGLETLSPMRWGEGDTYIYEHSRAEEHMEYKAKALPSLRVFELVGFIGGDDDVNLVLIILDMAVQLHTFICHPLFSMELYHVCRSRATKLESFVAPKVDNYVIAICEQLE